MAELLEGGPANANQGKRVLIHAVAGGVGTAAVEIGKLLGLEMYGTSSSDDKLARVKELGLQHGINYKTQDYEKAIAEMTNGGRVLITQEKKNEADGTVTSSIGKADKAVYNATTGDITLTGNPEIRQGISKVVPAEEGVTLIINRDGR